MESKLVIYKININYIRLTNTIIKITTLLTIVYNKISIKEAITNYLNNSKFLLLQYYLFKLLVYRILNINTIIDNFIVV